LILILIFAIISNPGYLPYYNDNKNQEVINALRKSLQAVAGYNILKIPNKGNKSEEFLIAEDKNPPE